METDSLPKGISISSQKSTDSPKIHFIFDNYVIADPDGIPGDSDEVTLNGYIDLTLQVPFSLKINEGEIHADAGVVAEEEINLTVNCPLANINLNKVISLWKLPIHPFYFMVGPVPVVFVGSFYGNLNIDFNLKSNVTASIDESFSSKMGVKFDKQKDGEGIFTPYFEKNFFFNNFQPPKLNFTLTLNASAIAGIKELLYGVVGPDLNISGYYKIFADADANPWWTMYGGISSYADIDFNMISKNSKVYSKEIFNVSNQIGKADGAFPGSAKTLDSLVIQPDSIEGKDAWIGDYTYPDGSHSYLGSGNNNWIEIRYENPGDWMLTEKAVMQFPLISVPRDIKIKSAKLKLWSYAASNNGYVNLIINKINSFWDASKIKGGDDLNLSYFSTWTVYDTDNYFYWESFDITDLVNGWLAQKDNNGVELSVGYHDLDTFGFFSSEYSNPLLRPKLIIYYEK